MRRARSIAVFVVLALGASALLFWYLPEEPSEAQSHWVTPGNRSDRLLNRWGQYAQRTRLPDGQVVFSVDDAVALMGQHSASVFFSQRFHFRIWKPGMPAPFGYRATGRDNDFGAREKELDAIRRRPLWKSENLESYPELASINSSESFTKRQEMSATGGSLTGAKDVNLLTDQTDFYLRAYQWEILVDQTFLTDHDTVWVFRPRALEAVLLDQDFYFDGKTAADLTRELGGGDEVDALPLLRSLVNGINVPPGSSATFHRKSGSLSLHTSLPCINELANYYMFESYRSARARRKTETKHRLMDLYALIWWKLRAPEWLPPPQSYGRPFAL